LIGLSYLKNLQELDVSNNQLKVKFIEVLNHWTSIFSGNSLRSRRQQRSGFVPTSSEPQWTWSRICSFVVCWISVSNTFGFVQQCIGTLGFHFYAEPSVASFKALQQ
jgi:hypothetical protein